MHYVQVHSTGTRLTVGKIFCIGKNYAEHAKEMNSELPATPVVFLKPPTAIIHDGDDIVFPRLSHQLHHEVELVVAIGKAGKSVKVGNAQEHILGYGIGLDMTLRDIQSEAKKKGLPWSVAKGFDTSAPVSEIFARESVQDYRALTIRCSVNGSLRQESSAGEMIFSPERLISYISSIFTLEEGDLIFTGTPHGVGEVKPGDRLEAELAGLTKICHRITAQGDAA
jgi:2-keto-4-pentenoate hydratase/2-oxohepta-3-ene-1,7-dioic acid hydratase in catechol pathway